MALEIVVPDPVRNVGQYVLERHQEWKRAMDSELRPRWSRLEKRYLNYRKDQVTSKEGSEIVYANLGIPLPSQTVDTLCARVRTDLFRQKPYGRLLPREPGDKPRAEQHQKVIEYQQDAVQYVRRVMQAIKNAYIFGVGPVKLVFMPKSQVMPVPLYDNGGFIGAVRGSKVVLESPVPIPIHPNDLFFQPDAPSEEDAEGFIHRIWMTTGELLNAVDPYGRPLYHPDLVEEIRQAKSSVDVDHEARQTDKSRGVSDTGSGMYKADKHEFFEYYGCVPYEEAKRLVQTQEYSGYDPYGDWIVGIVNGTTTTLRVDPSPHFTTQRPYFFTRIAEESGHLFASGIIEVVEKLGLLVDELYNLIVANMNVIIHKPVYTNTMAGIKSMKMGPGARWEGRLAPKDAFSTVDFPDLSQSIFILIRLLVSHYKEYTGVTDPVLASGMSGDQTATEFQGLLASAATRNALHESVIEDTLLTPMMGLWVAMNQQYLTDDFYVRIFKDTEYQLTRVSPEDIQGQFDFIFEGSSKQQSAAVATSQLMQLFQLDAGQMVQVFNRVELAKEIAMHLGIKDIDRFLNPDFAVQNKITTALQMVKQLGETRQAVSPDQVKASTSNGKPASTHNTPAPISDGDIFKMVQEQVQPDLIKRQV